LSDGVTDSARDIAEDLEHLGRLRGYLVHQRKVHLPGGELIDAIDDYAGTDR